MRRECIRRGHRSYGGQRLIGDIHGPVMLLVLFQEETDDEGLRTSGGGVVL
jgi:hypothetical protein